MAGRNGLNHLSVSSRAGPAGDAVDPNVGEDRACHLALLSPDAEDLVLVPPVVLDYHPRPAEPEGLRLEVDVIEAAGRNLFVGPVRERCSDDPGGAGCAQVR